jgi:hypothetical protein
MKRIRVSRGSLGWSVVDYSTQVEYTWVVSCFSFMGRVIYLFTWEFRGALNVISLVAKIGSVEDFSVLPMKLSDCFLAHHLHLMIKFISRIGFWKGIRGDKVWSIWICSRMNTTKERDSSYWKKVQSVLIHQCP